MAGYLVESQIGYIQIHIVAGKPEYRRASLFGNWFGAWVGDRSFRTWCGLIWTLGRAIWKGSRSEKGTSDTVLKTVCEETFVAFFV